MLKRYSPTCAELGCLVVSASYRKQGRGDAMLSFVERTAIAAGVERLFELCDLLPPIRGEEKVDDVVIQILLAAQVLVDEAPDDGGPVGEPHHLGLGNNP